MRTSGGAFLLLVLALAPAAATAQDQPRPGDVAALQEAVQQAIARAEPSIACVLVSRSDGYREFGEGPSGEPGKLGGFHHPSRRGWVFPDPDPRLRQKLLALDLSNPDTVPESYGSGVVIDESGLVLTQAHVIHRATKVYVRLPGGRGSWADVHAADPRSDLAVLRLIDPVPGLRAIRIGDGGRLRKGSFVLALANPFAAGFRDGSPSASWGIVSNLRRRSPGMTSDVDRARQALHNFGTLVQTDVRLHAGCSGGALLNLDGELVGLTTAVAALSGAETPGGFAVPMDARMRGIVEVLRRGEEVEYGFLGVFLDIDSRPGQGAVLKAVAPGSPAQEAGLLPGDRIVRINGTPVVENDDLFLLIGAQLAGSKAVVEVAGRAGMMRHTCTVTLAKYAVPGNPIASNRPRPRAGLRVDYASVLGQLRGGEIPRGVAVREVVPGSPADRARLQPDAVITAVNDHEVKTPAEFYREMDRAAGPVDLTYLNASGNPETVRLQGR
jgi:S1-C subfamily serine protease